MINRELEHPGVSRRDFLKIAALTGLGYSALRSREATINDSPLWRRDYQLLPPQFPAPPELRGVAVNFPYLSSWLPFPALLEDILENARQMGARYIRVFLSDAFESELGDYKFGYLEDIAKLSEKFPLQVDITDGHNIFHKQGTSCQSPFLRSEYGDLTSQRLAIFDETEVRDMLVNREYEVARFFRDVPNVTSLSIANEFEPPARTLSEKQELMMNLYPLLVTAVYEAAPSKPLVAGVANPLFIDEVALKKSGLTANTIHIYPESVTQNTEAIVEKLKYQPKALPLLLQEIGFPSVLSIGPLEMSLPFQDRMTAGFFDRTFSLFGEVTKEDNWRRLGLEGFVPWRLSLQGNFHRDKFGLLPHKLPLTMNILQMIQGFFAATAIGDRNFKQPVGPAESMPFIKPAADECS